MRIFALIALVYALVFNACGDSDTKSVESSAINKEIVIGATPVPHSEILEFIKPELQKQGITLKIVGFNDYTTPNISLADKSLDANFFQHRPYLDSMNKERGLNLVAVADVHVEPMGVYSAKIENIQDLKPHSQIAIPNDTTNLGRALILLHNNGIIKLKDASNLSSTEADIIENPKQLHIVPIEAGLLPRRYSDYDAAIINSNFALQANLKTRDALLVEDRQSPYVNILVTREDNANDEAILALKNALQTQAVKEFIKSKYDGELVPVF